MRTVLITGTSSGFGLLATVELARRGWRVFATMRDLDRKGPLLAALDAAGVRNAVEISRLDVTQPASVREAVAAMLLATGGRLDAVVQNAGVAAGGAFEDLPDEDARRVMETNFFGVLDLTRVAKESGKKAPQAPVKRKTLTKKTPATKRAPGASKKGGRSRQA